MGRKPMAEPIRNPKPFRNQELDRPEEHFDGEIEAVVTSSVTAVGGIPAGVPPSMLDETPRGKVVEWKQAAGQKLEQTLEQTKDRAAEVLDRAKQRTSQVLDDAGARISDAYRESARRARDLAHGARVRARYYADEYPLHVIAGAAAVGFAVGVLLRIWRSNRYE